MGNGGRTGGNFKPHKYSNQILQTIALECTGYSAAPQDRAAPHEIATLPIRRIVSDVFFVVRAGTFARAGTCGAQCVSAFRCHFAPNINVGLAVPRSWNLIIGVARQAHRPFRGAACATEAEYPLQEVTWSSYA